MTRRCPRSRWSSVTHRDTSESRPQDGVYQLWCYLSTLPEEDGATIDVRPYSTEYVLVFIGELGL